MEVMLQMGKDKIPLEVWNFCRDQIKKYPLYEGYLNEEVKEARIKFEYAGGCKQMDASGVVSGDYSSSPTMNKYESLEKFWNRSDILYLNKCVERMQSAIQSLEPMEREALEAIWKAGWKDNCAIARMINMGETTVKKSKRVIIKAVAIRWGMWS
jgi:hypothetical protein